MSFPESDSFSCGPAALKIVFNILGIVSSDKEIAKLLSTKEKQISLAELTKVARQKGLKPKVAKINSSDIQNVNTPFIALVNPEHYVVVTDTSQAQVKFIDPSQPKEAQTAAFEKFAKDFKGYALIFIEDKKLAKAKIISPQAQELNNLKGGVCWCCPPSGLGGVGSNPNTEYDGKPPCSVGMPSWMVNTANLNLIVQDIDFSYTSKGMPVEFIRTYNADDPREGVFGRSWTFNYNVSLVENPDTSIDVRRGDGKVDHFFWNGTRYQAPEGIYDTLVKNSDNIYSLKLKANKTIQNFDTAGRLLNIKDRNNNAITFNYDSEGKLTTIVDPNGKNTTLTYNPNKKVSKITLPDSRNINFVYDVNNNLIQSIDMVSATISFTYDSSSYLTAITTPHQGTTTIAYNTSSEGYYLKSITDALGNKRKYATYESDNQIRILDAKNNPTIYANDHDGYTKSITTATGNKISFEYNSLGNRTKIKDTTGSTTALTYDGGGNVTSVIDALANEAHLEYDAEDNLTKITGPKSDITSFTYDAKGNLTQIKDADNKITGFSYNSFGQLSRLTDANGQSTDFTYDTQGNLIQETNPLGKLAQYSYDTLGRLLTLTDPKGQTFSYIYDGVDHLTKITYPDNSTASYTYNCCNLIQIQDKNGTLKFSYDAIGRLKSFTNYDDKVIAYDYDSTDNLIKLTYPDNKTAGYEYDKDNRLVKVTDWLNNITSYSYDSRGNLTLAESSGLLTAYKYDTLSRITKLLNYNSFNMEIISGFEFTLDELSNRTKIKRYMPLNKPTFNLASSSYYYNSDNQLTSATGKTFTYDDNGNMTGIAQSAGNIALTYDLDNQLTQYTQGTTALSYQYDALGNRIKKTQGLNLTKYMVDPNRGLPSVLCETDSSGNITAYYVYGLGLISKIIGSNAYIYQYDGIGSTVALIDKNGAVLNKYAYDDFGNLATNSTETIPNSFKYVGKFGVMTDLPDFLYMRARYYMPSIGRFTQYDPLGAINPYSYVSNNPINLIDPSGNQEVIEGAIIPIAIIAIIISVMQFSQSKHTKEVIEGLARTMQEHAGKICSGSPNDPNKDHWKKEIKAAKERIQRLLKRLKGSTKEYYEKVIETIENNIR